MPDSRLVAVAACALTLGACGGPRAEAPTPTAASTAPPASPDPRELDADATYTDVVTAARRAAEAGDGSSNTGCLLIDGHDGEVHLDAELAVPVRPLPDPPADLGERLGLHRGAVSAISIWGRQSEAEALAVATFTFLRPRPLPAAALFLTRRGVFVRTLGGPLPASLTGGPLPSSELRARLDDAHVEGPLVVTADADRPVAELRALLAQLTAGDHDVALAVALPEGTRLPPVTLSDAPVPADLGLCPDGLPPLPEDAAEGELPREAIGPSLAFLPHAMERCMWTTDLPPGGAVTLRLALRAGPDGSVTDACFTADDAGTPRLRACILEAVAQARFPAPSPSGTVDMELPLRFAVPQEAASTPTVSGAHRPCR